MQLARSPDLCSIIDVIAIVKYKYSDFFVMVLDEYFLVNLPFFWCCGFFVGWLVFKLERVVPPNLLESSQDNVIDSHRNALSYSKTNALMAVWENL